MKVAINVVAMILALVALVAMVDWFLGGLGLVLTAVMVFMMMSFRGMEVQAMLWRAVKCLIWEAALALLANLAINAAAFFLFDSHGDFRSKKR